MIFRMRLTINCLLIIALFFISCLFLNKIQAQTTEQFLLSGQIVDENNEAVISAHIYIDAIKSGTVSDISGHFSLQIPLSFPLQIEISALGFLSEKIQLHQKPESPLLIVLKADQYFLQQVEITGSRMSGLNSQKIDPIHVGNLPSASGPSIEGLVRSQMGVTSNNELSSQYRVRGGSFDENLVYVNGQEIHRPFLIHSGQQEGLSFVNPDLVESIEFSAGGFSASYGDKMSSVLDITYKRPTKTAGSFSAGMLGANGHLEGAALNKKLSWITGVRYKTNRYLLGSLEEKGDYKPEFADAQAFMSYKANTRLTFELLGYYSLNSYEFIPQTRETTFGTISDIKRLRIYFAGKEKDRFETGYGALSTIFNLSDKQSYRLTFSGFRTFEEEAFDIAGAYWLQEVVNPYDDDDEGVQIGIGEYLQHARNDLFANVLSANLEGTIKSPASTTQWGLNYRYDSFKDQINEWEIRDSAGYSIPINTQQLELSHSKNSNHHIKTDRFSAFVKNQSSFHIGNAHLIMDVGIRGSYHSLNEQLIFGPRIILNYLPGKEKKYRLRLSGGSYYQPPQFKEIRSTESTVNKNVKAQKSVHLVSGFDYYFHTLNRPFKFTSEVYYKFLDQLIPYQVDNVRIIYSEEDRAKGYAFGIDFKINGELVPGEESWATLSLMKTEENLYNDKWLDPDREGEPGYIPRPSDQRLNFSLFLQDHLPNNPNFKAHLNFNFGTGLPFGPPHSPRYAAINRMPPYRRLDMGFSYDLLSKQSDSNRKALNLKNLWLGLEILNLPNIDNTISYYWVTDIYSMQYAVPNYLTSRRVNIKLSAKF